MLGLNLQHLVQVLDLVAQVPPLLLQNAQLDLELLNENGLVSLLLVHVLLVLVLLLVLPIGLPALHHF